MHKQTHRIMHKSAHRQKNLMHCDGKRSRKTEKKGWEKDIRQEGIKTQNYHSVWFGDLVKVSLFVYVCVQRGDKPNQLKLLPLIQRGSARFAFLPQFN